MDLISEAIDDKYFHGKIPQLLLSSVGSNTAVYLYTPEKSQIQSQFLATIFLFLTKHSFSVGMKPSKHAG